MADVLLINSVIREFAPPNNVPLGVLYIAAVLEKHGHNVEVCDLNALRAFYLDREFWLERYMKPYDFIGISGLIPTFQEQRRYLDYIMDNYEAFGKPVLISGGGLATSVPEFCFRYMPELDVLVLGEGEVTMFELVSRDKPLWEIQGIMYEARPGRFVTTQRRELISDLDSLPFPAWGKVPVVSVYLRNPIWGGDAGNSSRIDHKAKYSMNMIVSRGCPYNCNFCASSVMGKRYRMRSVQNVIDEIKLLQWKYNVDFVGFVDDNTTAKRSWVMHFCEQLLKQEIGIHWGGSARVDAVDPEMLALMKRAGCEWLGFGVESASPKILNAMNKKADPEAAVEAVQMVRDAGIWANTTFIAGYPGETIDDLRMTATWMRENSCLNSMFFATAYPGTQLYAEQKPKILEKYEDEDTYISCLADATDFRVNFSEMLDGELIEYRQMAMAGVAF